jgi:isopenicillin-N epimerase
VRFGHLRKRDLPGVKILNSKDPAQSCAIGFSKVGKIEAPALSKYLWENIASGRWPSPRPANTRVYNITPNVYTTLEEIDSFREMLTKILKKIPA